MKKKSIYLDHRLFAEDIGVTILTEENFQLYANTMSPNYDAIHNYAGNIDAWESYFDKISKYPRLTKTLKLLRSDYWNLTDPATACRRLITELKKIRPELDPEKKEHVTLFFHLSSLFVRSLAIIVTKLFKSYLHPNEMKDLTNALLYLIYGGKEAYDHRNQLYKYAKKNANSSHIPDLELPEWPKFVDLVRQFLDSPVSAQHAPLILIEAGLSNQAPTPSLNFLTTIATQGGHAAKFALFANSYLSKAARLPPEFETLSDKILLPIQP